MCEQLFCDNFQVVTMSEEDLRATILGWESGLKVERVPNPNGGDGLYYVHLSLMSPAQGQMLETGTVKVRLSAGQAEPKPSVASPATDKVSDCVMKARLVTCGLSEGRRRQMMKGKYVFSKAQIERLRKRRRLALGRTWKWPVFRSVVKTGKSVSKAEAHMEGRD